MTLGAHLSYFQLQADHMDNETAKKLAGKIKAVSQNGAGHQGYLVKYDLAIWIIGTDVKHIRIALRMG